MTHATHLPTTPIPALPAPSRQPALDAAHTLLTGSGLGGSMREVLDQRVAQALIDAERKGFENATAAARSVMQGFIDQRTSLAAARRTVAMRHLSEPDGCIPAAGELRHAGDLLSQASAVRQLINALDDQR